MTRAEWRSSEGLLGGGCSAQGLLDPKKTLLWGEGRTRAGVSWARGQGGEARPSQAQEPWLGIMTDKSRRHRGCADTRNSFFHHLWEPTAEGL